MPGPPLRPPEVGRGRDRWLDSAEAFDSRDLSSFATTLSRSSRYVFSYIFTGSTAGRSSIAANAGAAAATQREAFATPLRTSQKISQHEIVVLLYSTTLLVHVTARAVTRAA